MDSKVYNYSINYGEKTGVVFADSLYHAREKMKQVSPTSSVNLWEASHITGDVVLTTTELEYAILRINHPEIVKGNETRKITVKVRVRRDMEAGKIFQHYHAELDRKVAQKVKETQATEFHITKTWYLNDENALQYEFEETRS